MAEQRKVGYNESLTVWASGKVRGTDGPYRAEGRASDAPIRRIPPEGNIPTEPINQSRHPICRQAPCRRVCKNNNAPVAFPARPSQLSSRVVPNQADLRAIQRWKEADRDGGGTLDFNEVCPHCALPFGSNPSPSPLPLPLPRLAASVPDRDPSSMMGMMGRRTGRHAVRIPRCSLVLRAAL